MNRRAFLAASATAAASSTAASAEIKEPTILAQAARPEPGADLKAEALSLNAVNAAVDRAVASIGDKYKIQLQPGFHLSPGTILGRILREKMSDLGKLQQLATEITQNVAQQQGIPHGSLRPTVAWQQAHIIVGYIDPGRLLRL
jgi:hypothetical protein